MSQTFWIAVKALIQNPDGKFLLLMRSEREEHFPNDFDIPWWRIERGEQPEDAIVREVQEECWLKAKVEKVTRTRTITKENFCLVGITFLVKCENVTKIVLSNEHTDFFWKNKEEILIGEFPEWLKKEILTL